MTVRTRLRPPAGPPCLAEAEQAHVRTRWRQQFGEHWPGAESLLASISPPNWALEWSLPGWLGDAVGLPAARIRDVTLGNVLGLAYVRLHDDLSDELLSDQARAEAQALAARLYEQWLAVYSTLFGEDVHFWNRFAVYLDQWQQACQDSEQLPAIPFERYDETHFLALGRRGALIKTCAAASCVLAGRNAQLPQFEGCLDQLMIGAVLFDHAVDWGDDLQAARPNAFVAYASPGQQSAAHLSRNRSAVLRELTIGHKARPYFAVMDGRLAAAQAAAEDAGVQPLAAFIGWLRQHAAAYRRRLTRAARADLRVIAAALLNAPAA